MRISSPWTTKNKLLKQAATFFALGSLSLTAIAAPLDKSNIEFIGPLGENMQVKPFQTPHGQVIINNLLEQLQRNTQSVSVFGKKHSWQPFNKVNALTLGGLQALKFNIETTRYSQGTLTIKGIENAQLFIDAKLQKGDNHTYSLSLTNGSHSVIVVAQQVANWNNVSLDFEPKADTDNITINTSTTKRLSAEQLFDAPTISGLSLAPDAKQYVTSTRSYSNKTANQANVVTELKNSQNQTLYRFEGQQPSNMVWSPNNQFLVYMLGSELKQLNRKNLSIKTLARELEGASNFNFYDNNSLIFSWSKTPEGNNSLTKHYKGLQDRWSYARNVSQLYMLDTNSGLTKALSQGPISHSFEDANTNRGKVLMSRQVMVMQATTHPETELVELDLQSNKITSFGKFKTFNHAKYANKDVYVVAGPDFKNGAGRALPKGMLANNYDGQLYLLSDNGKNVKALSKQFDPAIGELHVLDNGDALIKVTEQDTQPLYLYDLSKQRFKKLNTGLDIVEQFSYSHERNPQVLLSGTTASTPQQLKRLNISKNKTDLIWDSKPLAYANTQIPTLEEFNFTNKDGVEITGRVYIPTNLDKTKKHPALVYYYGGTSPVTRGFTGRYPFNLWAANGYVVYVLQPTGATGFGQTFSAQHVNAWGDYTASDIMQGTHAFLKKYDFVDSKKVGNLGASYGGFMTMLLATKTDMFSASIAHAGISNLTSYWGEGWWGYLYSGEASKNSFPWNNASLYSDHSPVFHADKVTTPLLLLHGDSDTNVPVGESLTMYTALKLLNKDVELIEYKGADHQIFARDKRFDWWNTMLAYFDKQLKGEPQWWDAMYSDK
ncbi:MULTISPECIES: alpha/beta hydrolase family protein [unclassified Pseudoalteromonas]|uniref:alpha/beta hydrolase family protein n=1 Tax=unclassified Pseudoalteromonas TaxID=194690 RepID=UPI000B6815CC|nr:MULTISPECIES: S9 family peptidase [unclassified Pseudoalteromonas]MAJ39233.1 S9 family peptidase [Pseudoalteromonadaceae bacterium]OUX91334.1 MAG: S9 family peptidase [Pseudoalteromonas sp. TMED43]MDC9566624.1 S9 family peptidase [Pseudoalteromonas sp. GAB2316C]MDC9570866.1 S9 family peptidase [Pseudoalteromonas sp. GABNB9D]MDC9575078.1 S9 family peptidase [Pseudoalteromonas sp. GABNS16A]